MKKSDITSYTLEELVEIFKQEGHSTFRGEQVFSWIHEKRVFDFQEMTNLSKDLRAWLEENYSLSLFPIKEKQVSQIDNTSKYLFQLEDGNAIESVVMEYDHGLSLCVSTQVGCRMNCSFCASTIGGLERNLTSGEILKQVYTVEKDTGSTISNIVLMGIGEPLDNLDNVVTFLKIVSHPKGKHLSLRSITLSTCGIVDKIYQLADMEMPITLAISLHAPTDQRRSQLMSINKKWNIQELLEAADYYFNKTGRRVTIEYGLIDGVNDSKGEAEQLALVLEKRGVHINLIPINPVVGKSYKQSQGNAVGNFQKVLINRGYSVTIRRELGRDISAACGQLRHEHLGS